VFGLVNLYSLLVYIEHNGDESPKGLYALFVLSVSTLAVLLSSCLSKDLFS